MSDIFGFEASPFDESVDATPVSNDTVTVEDKDGNEVVVDKISVAWPIAQEIRDKEAQLAEINDRLDAYKDEVDELTKRKGELEREFNKITVRLHEIEKETFEDRRARNNMLREITSLRIKLSQAMFAELNAAKMRGNIINFDKTIAQYGYSERILEHQREGAYILATNQRVILGDKRGAGKTLTAIASWDMAQAQRVLVIVPDDVVSNFVNEIHYWAPHRNVMQLGKMTPAARAFAIEMARTLPSFTMVLNYSAWRKDKSLLDALVSLKFDTVCLDEAHELKNTSTSAYKGVKHIVLSQNACPKCNGDIVTVRNTGTFLIKGCKNCGWEASGSRSEFLEACSVKSVVPMTGTVILNKPQDLFALLSLVDPVNFVEPRDFLTTYCTQDYYTQKWKFRPGGLDSLQKKLSGKFIARPGVSTPGQSVYTHDLEIDPQAYPDQYRVIKQLSESAQILLDSGVAMPVLYQIALITRKRQANVWPAGIQFKDPDGNVLLDVGEDVQESIKIDKCINNLNGEWDGLIPELTENGDMDLGARVVVFSQFKGPLKELERRLKSAGISVVRFDGDTPQKVRDEAKIDFDRKYCEQPGYEPKWQVILCNYKTGGVGLNFTAATETIILDREWNPGKEDQAFGRTDRLGQTEHTNVHIIRLAKTVDVWLDDLIAEKADIIAGFEKVGGSITDNLFDAIKRGEIL